MGVLKLFTGTGDLECVVTTIKTPEGSLQKVIDGVSFSVGRAPDCVLSIPHAGISRLHILVTIKRSEVYIVDQESSNGTFLNGEKIEPKRLTLVKPTDQVKLGLSDVIMQFTVMEKHFKTDYIAESLLPSHEKDNLLALINASNHKAQEIISSAQMQADHITRVSEEKASNLENQTLLRQEEIISSAQVEGQHYVSDSKRKAAQILLENEEKVKESCQNIYDQAERIRKEAEAYFQNRVQEAEVRGTEIIEQHTKLGKEVIEELREKITKKTEQEVKEKLAAVVNEIEDKEKQLAELKSACIHFEFDRKSEIEKEIKKIQDDFKNQFEQNKAEKFTVIQKQIENLENEYAEKTTSLENEYSQKATRLENEYTQKVTSLENEYTQKAKNFESAYVTRTAEAEKSFNKIKSDFEEQHRQNIDESAASILKQKKLLETELQSQRQQLSQVTNDLNTTSAKYNEIKTKVDDVQSLLGNLQNNESNLIASLNEKREQTKKAEIDLQKIKAEIDSEQEKFLTSKHANESQIEDYQLRLGKLKSAFEAESQRLKKESEEEIDNYKQELKKIKEQYDQQLKMEKSEIHRKTIDYMDSERSKVDEYRAQMLQEKKQLDQNFDKTKREFEAKTKEAIELEKQKVEDIRQGFMVNLNRERQAIADEITIAIMKIKNHESLTATSVSDTVVRVFNSHVVSHSMDKSIKTANLDVNKLKLQFLGYGLGIALVAVFGFKLLIQPQINRHIAGTDEHAEASIPVERPKYTPQKVREYKDSYTDAVLYTEKFPDIYLDEQLHDKWFKHISGYMYENWRVDESKSIEAISISKTLVQNLKETSLNLDAEFYLQGIEKMRELEQSSEKRMIEILGTKVKYEAYKRKEHEFFEPYVQNQ